MRRWRYITVTFLLLLGVLSHPAYAGRSLIRDAEIEHVLHSYGDPIFRTAGLNPEAIHLFIVNDPAINAFVAGGSNMFIHTGLMLACETPDMLIGVMAHETGHIAGGHLAQGTEKLKNAQLGSILSYILGGAAVISGAQEVGSAIMAGGQQTAMRNYLAFSRGNEQAADQAALTYMDANAISAEGFLRMMEKLRQKESRAYGTPDPYVLTHPLGKDRIMHIRNHVMNSPPQASDATVQYSQMHKRLLAKLYGFLEPTERTLAKYPPGDQSVEARYARAVAWYKVPDIEKSLTEINSLLKESPKDPFFNELKGQILFENGRVEEAMTSYQKAVDLLPSSPLIRTDLAKAQIASGDVQMIDAAIRNLELTTTQDSTNPSAWRLLATAYGKRNRPGMSALALAEEAFLQGNAGGVLLQVKIALKQLPSTSPASIRAQDLQTLAEKMKEDIKENQ